ncbi:hypothetical protein PSQ20_00110 [Curvibacter sp. RS43]|uniref:hypothetical protein n=1 Tax=Curvibacter microcysteis TaxID=3026419 RepID=UPI00236037C2|nr:hypothetical protein [Curvibacter sp. RS43]MDD0808726.1 hypothetical protein [Curvibacter sp. RS43]
MRKDELLRNRTGFRLSAMGAGTIRINRAGRTHYQAKHTKTHKSNSSEISYSHKKEATCNEPKTKRPSMPTQKNPLHGKIPIFISGVLYSCNIFAACLSATKIFENLYKHDYYFAFKNPAQLITPFSADFNNLLKQEFLCKQAGDS